jgi:hypothetical protein
MDTERRRFLKLLAFGGITFVAGKIFGGFWEYFSTPEGKTFLFRNFKIVESGKELGVYDSSGDKILVVDKQK